MGPAVGKLDALLKVSVIAGVLFASASIGYYFSVYLPHRDLQLDAQRIEEKQRADAAKQAQQERQDEEQATAQMRYQACLKDASDNYSAVWASSCKRGPAKVGRSGELRARKGAMRFRLPTPGCVA
jgi:hypothetical protein